MAGAIHADRTNLAQTQMLGQLQHAHKRWLERLLVGGAKRADRTAETSASGGLSLQSVRACCFDAVREKKLNNIPLIIDRGQSADQMANAI
jgi:hypothetical protein